MNVADWVTLGVNCFLGVFLLVFYGLALYYHKKYHELLEKTGGGAEATKTVIESLVKGTGKYTVREYCNGYD